MIFAAIALVGAFISGIVQSGMIISHHRKGYRPALWLQVALGFSAFVSFYFAAGYLVIIARWVEPVIISTYYFRPMIPFLFLGTAVISVYAIQQAAQHEEFVTLQEQFVANVSHELRTPLSIIGGFAEMLVAQWENTAEETRRDHLGYIHHQTVSLKWLIQTMLDFYKSNEDTLLSGGHDPVDMGQLVTETVTAVRLAIAEPKGVVLTLLHADPVIVTGHPVRLELMLNNLLVNAVKFSPPNSTGGTVDVELRQTAQGALLIVRDTGIGIDPAFMPHLFTPFRQGDGSDRRRFGGVGLGLAVVKQIVESHHGRIAVESELGKGSTFRVWL